MFSNWLVKKFIKDSLNAKSSNVRNTYGLLAGIVGIIVNVILFAVKLSVGIFTNSIAITADAFNNFSDTASSLITIIGFKLSSMPADDEHPFGHGRIEYLSALAVSFMVMFVGIQFVKTSFNRIFNPSKVIFEIVPFILMILSIFVKIWMSKFNSFIGNKINSSALKASSLDALSDVITSSVVALSLLLSKFTSIPVDGYIGMIVAALIVYSGFKLVKETINPLLGEAPDEELVDSIKNNILSYSIISGVHDLIIHNYGPGRCMASIHAEVPANMDITDIHTVIDTAEREVSEKLNIILVIHMDPINVDDNEILETKEHLLQILEEFKMVESIHDFRIVGKGICKNLIFDIVINPSLKIKHNDTVILKEKIQEKVKKRFPEYNCIITVDRNYTSI
ncbi:cation diffusion facilitator family transporter [Clostridium oryzae]|uniref:cation diffusion facilitator family transporter n=1 Tax=Clostridium oryzae TaxID=1450648 RepID=UPI0009A498D3|nr:cation diffusion facilitator family transporter [Clostridium oryzae]